ncbi:hypothetical protein J5A56_00495 [Prevotella melaninogenica]|uniref:hypothetical protein n=1 Tax=Prevotella TaxID=838 RepID=UPI0003AD09AD|nr:MULTISPECIES: hypothetical protein [Prevotella]ERJ75375.1 hypothetical protein HMPREF9148_01936 [Prevotella sp. F0091]QUB72915.1 hypothetical protein J5A56_00495 [Prevotella melaninogenica]
MMQIVFSDKVVTYDTFMNDLAARITSFLQNDKNEPEMISQRQAYKIFGRGNVDRWRKNGLINPCVRPGKREYSTRRLRELQRTEQDYL